MIDDKNSLSKLLRLEGTAAEILDKLYCSFGLLLFILLGTYFVASCIRFLQLLIRKIGDKHRPEYHDNSSHRSRNYISDYLPSFLWTGLTLWLIIKVLGQYEDSLESSQALPSLWWLSAAGSVTFALPLGLFLWQRVHNQSLLEFRAQKWSFRRAFLISSPILLAISTGLVCLAEVAFRIPGWGQQFVEACRHHTSISSQGFSTDSTLLIITAIITICCLVFGVITGSLRFAKRSETNSLTTADSKNEHTHLDPLPLLLSYIALALIFFFPLLLSFLPLLSELTLPMPEYPVTGTLGEELSKATYRSLLRVAPAIGIALVLCLPAWPIIARRKAAASALSQSAETFLRSLSLHIPWLLLLLAAHAFASLKATTIVLGAFCLLNLWQQQFEFANNTSPASNSQLQKQKWLIHLTTRAARLLPILLALDATFCFLIFRNSQAAIPEPQNYTIGEGGLGELAARLEGTVFHLILMGLSPALILTLISVALILWARYLEKHFLHYGQKQAK